MCFNSSSNSNAKIPSDVNLLMLSSRNAGTGSRAPLFPGKMLFHKVLAVRKLELPMEYVMGFKPCGCPEND